MLKVLKVLKVLNAVKHVRLTTACVLMLGSVNALGIPSGYSLISPPERLKRMTPYTCENANKKNAQVFLMIQFYNKYKNTDLLHDRFAAQTLIQLSPACKSLGMAGYTNQWSYKHYGKDGKSYIIKSYPMSHQSYNRFARRTMSDLLRCALPYDWKKGRTDNLVGCGSTTIAGHINKFK